MRRRNRNPIGGRRPGWDWEGRSELRTCVEPGCEKKTREGKPYCPDHVDKSLYVQDLFSQMAAHKDEKDKARLGQQDLRQHLELHPDSMPIKEMLLALKLRGPQTTHSLSRELQLEQEVIMAYVDYLVSEGKVITHPGKRPDTTFVRLVAEQQRRYNPLNEDGSPQPGCYCYACEVARKRTGRDWAFPPSIDDPSPNKPFGAGPLRPGSYFSGNTSKRWVRRASPNWRRRNPMRKRYETYDVRLNRLAVEVIGNNFADEHQNQRLRRMLDRVHPHEDIVLGARRWSMIKEQLYPVKRRNPDYLSVHCDSCEALAVNNVATHELGCPKSWINPATNIPYDVECGWCGSDFIPENPNQKFCDDDCAESFNS
jgi:hypothetical protein